MNTIFGSASMVDAAGNLLFYTNGSPVWSQNHNVMGNGTGLLGNSYHNPSTLMLKKPGSSNFYYVFAVQDSTIFPAVRWN